MDIGVLVVQVQEAASDGPFEDGQTRAFYEALPDLSGIVPPVLLPDVSRLASAPEEDADSPIATQSSEGAFGGSDAGLHGGQVRGTR